MNLAFLVSNNGSSLRAIVAAIEAGALNARPVLVVSNRKTAPALAFADDRGVPALCLPTTADPDAADRRLADALTAAGADLVVLSGYLRKLGPATLAAFGGRILNIHPALLPKHGGQGMYGRRVHEAVIAAGERESGATVHLVDDEYDHGDVVAQIRVPLSVDDDAAAVERKVMAAEPGLFVQTLQRLAAGELKLPGSAGEDQTRGESMKGELTGMVEITTALGKYHVWTKRVGVNPKLKLLLLHGGPGATHEYFEAFDSFLPGEGIEYIYYDQLGSGNSDKPTDQSLWTIERFVEEVEQVRKALDLDAGNFCVLGHSWGGILAMEYALKYQRNLKCLIISNMMASIPAYNDYARRVLTPPLNQKDLAEIQALEAAGKTDDLRYMELLVPMFYEKHVLRMPSDQWPEPVNRSFARINNDIYTLMQGPSELGASGRLEHWDRFADLSRITVPTLVIGARHDTMDPAYMEAMAKRLPKGEFLFLPDGSHLALYDDQARYFSGLLKFLKANE